ncbi:hypothetical protein ACHAXT_004925 [Thalassiosira profunda]
MAGNPAAPAPPPPALPNNGAPPVPAPGQGVANPLSAPVAPPPAGGAPAPLAMPPGTVNAQAPPPNAAGHAMPTHYQHQSQAMAPAPPLQHQPLQGMQHAPPVAANGQPPAMGQPGARPPQPMQHPQLQQQQARAPQPLNGGWQSDKDVEDRRKMIAKIVQLLRQRKPNAPQEWLNKLPQMAKRLEESLYRSAPSFVAYNDISTLKQRLQQLAMNIGMKTKRLQQQQQQAQQPGGQPLAQPQQPQYQQRAQQPPQQVAAPPQQGVPLQQPHLQQQPQQPQMVNMAQVNPNMAAQQQQQAAARAPAPPMNQANYAAAPPQPQQPNAGAPVAAPAAAPAAAAPAARQPSDRQQVLRHQQQRLLLLRHAAKCPHQDNQCPVTPHCAGMKRLWKHIAECKDQKCLVPHCVSSRYVLSHYHRCKDVRCPVCGPVREAIHRSHEKQKQMQALKQGHVAEMKARGGAPPTKRQKTANGQYASSMVPHQQAFPGHPQQAYQGQPGYRGQPGQPINPNVKAGYVYSHPAPGSATSGQPGAAPGGALALSNGKVIGGSSGPRPQEDHTLINCFTIPEIETHIKSLDQGMVIPVAKLKTKFGELLKGLQNHTHGWVFNTPVDPVELGLPDYFEVIEKPMDLGTVKKQLENNVYKSLKEVERDVNLTFDNAMLYNPDGSVVWNMAKELKDKLAKDLEGLMKQLHSEEEQKRQKGDACSLCGCEKLLFEPPVFYCNGKNCRSKRIRRNSYFFVGGNNQYHWCQPCYDDLKESKPIELADLTLRKSQLDKKKNNEVPEESWVQCDRCERWIHQICALFNTRQNTDQRSEFVCPTCTIADRKKKNKPEPSSTTPMAEDLPRTKMSEHLEKDVREKLKDKMAQMAKEKAEAENIPVEEAAKLVHEGGGEIYIRQVTSMSRTLDVRPRMKKRYSFKEYPSEFKYRCKCIVVFQNLDGVDVILFGLYVYEHDETNAAPNHRAVYVSYLDSVHFMRPRKMRTFIYHELLTSYLDYVRLKGYNTAHIWACPPLKGDDYILFAKPEDQKIPKDDRLRQWYLDMLKDCQRRGIVGKMTNAYDLYFANEKNDATVLPYMEGDYFPAEMENIIKDMEEGNNLSKKPTKAGKKGKKEKKKRAKAGSRGGTRSSGIDQEALDASGIVEEGVSIKSLQEGGRDWVMKKLGETIHPMRESFLVAYLNWEGQTEENMVVPKDIMEYREKHGISAKPALPAIKEEEKEAGAEDGKSTAEGEDAKKPAAEGNAEDKTTEADDAPAEDAKKEAGDAKKETDDAKEEADDAKNTESPVTAEAQEEEKEEGDEAGDKNEEKGNDGESGEKDDPMETEEVKGEPSEGEPDKAEESDKAKSGTEEAEKGEPMEEDDPAKEDPEEAGPDKDEPAKEEAGSDKGEAKSDNENGEEKPAEAEESKPSDDEAKEPSNEKKDEAAETEVKTDATPVVSEEVAVKKEGDEGEEKKDSSEGGEKADGDVGANAEPLAAESSSDAKDKEGEAGAKEEKKEEAADGEKAAATEEKSPEKSGSGSPDRGGKFAAMAKKHEEETTSADPDKPESSKSATGDIPPKSVTKDSKGRLVKVIDDDDEEMDCEFLNNRQLFLNLCQGNHYQFDSLRRAKHTSMMVLWHLHNRDAPKFVQQCAVCSREILQGKRYHCPTCADFDCCIDCLRNPAVPRHQHPLQAIPVGNQQSTLTPEQRKERQRSIALHMTLLLHASTCRSPKCSSANCAKMKGLLKHGAGCKIKANGGCNVCKRIWALLQIHARQCKTDNCPVPNCLAIRERYRQLQLQQQAMDDRRREALNAQYRGGAMR